MAITPNTNIFLLKNPLSIDNKNQLTFINKEEQFNFFNSLPKLEISNCSYQRKNNAIRYPALLDDILEYNYVMYQNENYNNKWFYAFIVHMNYINNNMTEIIIDTDVWQTWQFDINFKESFIEREMLSVADDVPGANLLPEGLETGEFKVNGTAEFDDLETVSVVAYSGDTIEGNTVQNLQQGGYIVNGINSSIVFLICENSKYTQLMNILLKGNNSQYIVSTFSLPKLAVQDFMTSDNELKNIITLNGVYALQNGKNYYQSPLLKTLINLPSQLDGYTPRNQKLRTYPYIYLGFNPSNGSQKIFRYENFNGSPQFKIISEVNPNPSIYFIPQNYRGQTGDSLSDICVLNGYPTLANKTDYYNSWLAQNSNIISLQMQQEQFNYDVGQMKSLLGAGTNMINGVASLNPAGLIDSINSGVDYYKNSVNHDFYIKQQMAQIEKQKMLPDNVSLSGSNATLIGYNMVDKNIFTRYTIKKQFAERIDKYFDMFGYLTNIVKLPNLNNRPNWNYIKTIGANILGNIPQNDLLQIKNMFDNGITLWHNSSTFLDYSQNNR